MNIIRRKTRRHQQLEILNSRSVLNDKEKNELDNLQKGLSGEVTFDEKVVELVVGRQCVHIKDFLFQYDNGRREIQIDNIIIAGDTMYLFEVKNYYFDLTIEGDEKYYFLNGDSFENLNAQVERQHIAIRELTRKLQVNIDILGFVVFVNPNQTVYGLRPNMRVITCSTLDRALSQLITPNRHNYSLLVRELNLLRSTRSLYDVDLNVIGDIPNWNKGILCPECWGFIEKVSNRTYRCDKCSNKYSCVEAVENLHREIKVLCGEGVTLNSRIFSELSGGQINSSTILKMRKSGRV